LARPLVAVIDSGVARTAELRRVLVAEYDMAAATARPEFQPRYDHGTMVATILTREAKGQVDIVSLRIDDPAGCPPKASPPCQPNPGPVTQAIRKAIDLKVTAINISLSLQDDPAIVEAVRAAAHQGILVVMAAGNQGHDHPGNLRMALAGSPRTVLVGAVDAAGQPWAGTNRPGAEGERPYEYVWRLGVDVPTAAASGASVTGTGTSFATPIETARRLVEPLTTVKASNSAGPKLAAAAVTLH
jgi:subtilisin family serine protease